MRKLLMAAGLAVAAGLAFQAQRKPAVPADPLLAGFARTTVASVSDAVDQITGQRGYMNHDMQARVAGRVVGRATTALLRPATPEQSTPATAIKHAVEMIDNAQPGQVGVIVVEDGIDMTGLGGLMATAASARGMAGMVIDGSIRDVGEIRSLGLPVYARGLIPATAVGRYLSVSRDEPVTCAGVAVKPGDIIVGGEDGVVVVPAARAREVLAKAREIDEKESKMAPFIQRFRSLTKAIESFNRI
ncbi:MAG: RraA family protein [Bryobacteraceae bacterium]